MSQSWKRLIPATALGMSLMLNPNPSKPIEEIRSPSVVLVNPEQNRITKIETAKIYEINLLSKDKVGDKLPIILELPKNIFRGNALQENESGADQSRFKTDLVSQINLRLENGNLLGIRLMRNKDQMTVRVDTEMSSTSFRVNKDGEINGVTGDYGERDEILVYEGYGIKITCSGFTNRLVIKY